MQISGLVKMTHNIFFFSFERCESMSKRLLTASLLVFHVFKGSTSPYLIMQLIQELSGITRSDNSHFVVLKIKCWLFNR